ncbi:two-component system, chemotaxis family, response regulator CheB [Selenomonas sp. WCT3]|uniref:chemotaxis protein CheB n=1 Tax=Selenomonas sp. WCT3 TaxID=3158785 RepID=UPI00088BD263|nr:two-component system, chemotaxis family, response regulator CheB [Selenomonas ruminantium]
MQGLRILLIENSIYFQDTCAQELLKRLPAGSLVEKNADPVDVKAKIQLFRPMVIIMNFAMSVITMDGNQLLPSFASQYPHIPIITYGLMDTSKKTALSFGAFAYLKKPGPEQSLEGFYEELVRLTADAAAASTSAPSTNVGPGAMVTKELWTAAMPKKGWLPLAPPTPAAPAVQSEPAAAAPITQPTPPIKTIPPSAPTPEEPKPIFIPAANKQAIQLIAIGSSTGGTEALSSILTHLRPPLPGIVIVQHIPPMFSRLLAQRLNDECVLTVKEGATGDIVRPGHVYIAPGNKHMTVHRCGGQIMLDCSPGEPVHSCCPSVDVLFDSVAQEIGAGALGVILTGMGKDGAEGLLHMRQKGSPTLGQDQQSCIVYGMPKAAFDSGAVEHQVSLRDMPRAITQTAR